MLNPLFSIIIPTYNSGRTIANCLDSILQQSLSNFEIIILDNNSIDNTIGQITELGRADKRIRIFQQADKGIYDAMNKGVQLSKGTWLYFLGSDDKFFDEEVLAKVYNVCASDDLDIVYGNIYSERFGGIYAGEFDAIKLEQQNISHQAIFFNRRVFKIVGDFNISFRGHADWEHNIRWFFNRKIRKRFVDITVAIYADGGFSSIHGDLNFYNSKDEIFLRFAQKYLSPKSKYDLCVRISYNKRTQGNILGYIFYALKSRLYKYA